MEFLYELFVTALVAVLVSFLISKLVSFAMAGGSVSETALFGETAGGEAVVMGEEFQFRERLEVDGFRSETRAASVEEVTEKVREFVGDTVMDEEVVKSVSRDEVIEEECSGLGQKAAEECLEEKKEGAFDVEEKNGGVAAYLNLVEQSEEIAEPEEVKEAEDLQDLIKASSEDERIGVETTEEVVKAVETEAKDKVEERKVEIESDEDDWEGIERSDLEKVFAKAAKFVECEDKDERLGNLGSDVQMVLYGLHKVATEGPCHEQPPLPLKLSARAKWY